MNKRDIRHKNYQEELQRQKDRIAVNSALLNVFKAMGKVIEDGEPVDSFDWHLLVREARKARIIQMEDACRWAGRDMTWRPFDWCSVYRPEKTNPADWK
jgi:hypothetical protein